MDPGPASPWKGRCPLRLPDEPGLRFTIDMTSGDPVQRDATTRALVESAVAELRAVGQADFAMERVARGAYFSVGSVYERWPDRAALLADIGGSPIASDLAQALESAPDAATAIEWVLADGVLLPGSEILLAGHLSPVVRASSLRVWSTLLEGLQRHIPPALAWYVATYAVGNALLGAIDVGGPEPARGRVRWLLDACEMADAMPRADAGAPLPGAVDIPVVPEPTRTDDVAAALISAAQVLLQERGAAGTHTRDIAAGAGVTTGALYRRYEGKSRLLADVLLTQLAPDRYTWTWDLVQALASPDPYAGAAAVVAARMVEVLEDAPAQQVLLQVGIAARNDPALREQIAQRIAVAHSARVDMVDHFVAAGLLRSDVDPGVLAWGFQTIPVGVRATTPLGIPLDVAAAHGSIAALIAASAARG